MESEIGLNEVLLDFLGSGCFRIMLISSMFSLFYYVRDKRKVKNNYKNVNYSLRNVHAKGMIGQKHQKINRTGLFVVTDKAIIFTPKDQAEILIPLQAIHDARVAQKKAGNNNDLVLKVQFYDKEAAPSEIHWLLKRKDMDIIWPKLGREG